MIVNIRRAHVQKFCLVQGHNLISVKLSQAHHMLTVEQWPVHSRVAQVGDT